MERPLRTEVNVGMSDIGKRLSVLREMRRKHLLQLRANCSVPEKDKNGSSSNSLIGTLRFLAVADYVLDRNVAAFRSALGEAAALRQGLLDRFDAGESISPSYVSMMTYKALFNALATGDKDLSGSFASKMGGRDAVEREYDRPFDIALGYTLKSLLVSDDVIAARYLEAFEQACEEPENADFKGYAAVLRGILDQNAGAVESGLSELITGHKRQSKGSGLFKDTEDEFLSVWGLGVANLARIRGLMVQANDPLIPTELIF